MCTAVCRLNEATLFASFKDDLLLLMSVLSQTLLALVGSHFVLFSFLSAWHNFLNFALPIYQEN